MINPKAQSEYQSIEERPSTLSLQRTSESDYKAFSREIAEKVNGNTKNMKIIFKKEE